MYDLVMLHVTNYVILCVTCMYMLHNTIYACYDHMCPHTSAGMTLCGWFMTFCGWLMYSYVSLQAFLPLFTCISRYISMQ